ncbi:7SK snRNA methylphosphate capping enzyme-like isoform X2 [Anthonomus grandis grandis]|uniref:7SK snRNA methylphosphate capping enzyme-like isoform X2 n=1 Tax=Anthonomus grandis grandis TaxID=2921223 RepID=UPI00216506AA|nr:7SK snRNA methylphosphate capping enzyme-like isoform X2 [Anthonomus grandis grandis]
MSSMKPLDPPASKPDSKPIGNRNHGNNKSQNNRKRFKDRGSRKRSKSFSGCGLINPKPVLPTKFLLGGNINDPLNLNSLQDEDINRAMNAVTPKSSPLPTPPRRKMRIEVIVSPNTHDPLHLLDCQDDIEYEEQLCSPIKKGRKKRIKKRRTMSSSVEGAIPDPTGKSEARTPEASSDSAKIPEDPELQDIIEKPVEVKPAQISKASRNLSFDCGKEKKDRPKRRSEDGNISNASKRFKNSMDKIVSPVVPQPGAWLKRSTSVKLPKPRQNKVPDEKEPVFKEANKRFQYGNYNRYYGYRNPNNDTDHRLRVFSHHPYLFENKDILDIGCNIGHITLSVARDFRARTVTGIDIDPKLISIARKNVKHYVKTEENTTAGSETTPDTKTVPEKSSRFHDSREQGRGFPKNVTFKQCNYVLEDESLLALEQPQFDIILCLSITKWIHLNWGDNGLKLAFRRMYEQLRPGGKLILEPQHWAGYKSKKKLTETIYKNYNSIEFFPDKFRDFLLSPTVGFAKSEILGYPQHRNSGFRRPIQVFTKSTMFPSERYEGATPSNPVYNDSVYTKIMETGKYESQTSLGPHREYVYTNICRPSTSYIPEDNQDSQNDICPTTSPNICTPSPTVFTPNSFTVSPNVCTRSPMVYSSSPNVSTKSPIVYAPSPNVSITSSPMVYAPVPNVCTTSPLERLSFSPEGSPYVVSEESCDHTKTPSRDSVITSCISANGIVTEEVSEVNSERKTDGDKT